MEKAKLFINGRSQAVRLPKAYRFKGNEVYIKKTSEGVLLIPKDQSIWDIWEQNLIKYKDSFMTDRNQPETQQERAGLDEIFS
jgi:antitoxin VapB